jgi:hypothetical protein
LHHDYQLSTGVITNPLTSDDQSASTGFPPEPDEVNGRLIADWMVDGGMLQRHLLKRDQSFRSDAEKLALLHLDDFALKVIAALRADDTRLDRPATRAPSAAHFIERCTIVALENEC